MEEQSAQEVVELTPVTSEKVEAVEAEIQAATEEALKESGREKLMAGQISVEVVKAFGSEPARATFTLLSEVAREAFHEVILPWLKKKYDKISAYQSPPNEATKTAAPFDSLEALAAAHTELLRREISADAADDDFLDQVKQLIVKGRATGLQLESVSERRTAQSLLNYWVTVVYRAGATNPPDAILVPYSKPIEFEPATAKCPYVGLNPFTEADHDRFYGRLGITGRFLQRLNENRLVVLVGPAGGGKTSVVNAGVVPELKDGKVLSGSEQWNYFTPIAPGRDPLTSLASLLAPRDASAAPIKEESETLLQDVNYLAKQLSDERFSGQPAVIVVDRFEEVFTLCKDDAQRETFIASLLNVIQSSEPSMPEHRVILVMRSDRTNYIIRRSDLKDLYPKAEVRIHPLRETDLRAVIREPARRIGLRFEAGLVTQLVGEIYGDQAGLPLLQFMLLKLWEEKDGDTITWAAKNRLGSCQNALLEGAKTWYKELSPEQKETARLVLLKMVRITDNLEVVGDRVRREDLCQAGECADRVNAVLNGLAKANLVRVTKSQAPAVNTSGAVNSEGIKSEISSDDQFQLVHASFWSDWEEFTVWLKRLRETLVTRQRLEAQAANWVILGRKDIGLLDKYQVHEAGDWLKSLEASEVGYNPDLTALVEKSRKAVVREKLVKRARLFALIVTILIASSLLLVQARLRQKNYKLELEKTKHESEAAFRVANVLRGMTSDVPEDRLLALSGIDSLVRTHEMHPKIGAAILSIAIKDGDQRVAAKAVEIVKQVSRSKDALAQSIGNAAYGDANLQELDALTPLYIHLASSDQEGRANKIKAALEEKGYIVPPFQVGGGRTPVTSQLSYNRSDMGGIDPASILTLLKEVDANPWSNKAVSSDQVHPGTFEIWLAGQFTQNGTLVISSEDENGNKMEGLAFQLFITSITNSEQKSIKSTSGFVYSLLPGKYRLTVKIKGYQRTNQTFSIRGGKDTLISLPLRPKT